MVLLYHITGCKSLGRVSVGRLRKNNWEVIDSMKIDYLCHNWQFYIQQIVYLVGNGYYHYYVGEISLDKLDKTKRIDKKIIKKYKVDLTKDQRYRRKKNGLVNYYYLRWSNQFLILHTDGKHDIELDDKFCDIRKKQTEINRLKVKVSAYMEFNIAVTKKYKDKYGVTVGLSNMAYKELKVRIEKYIKLKQVKKLNGLFANLRGLPAWKGIVKQEYKLLEEVYILAKKYNLNKKVNGKYVNGIKYPKEYPDLKLYTLKINTYRKVYNNIDIKNSYGDFNGLRDCPSGESYDIDLIAPNGAIRCIK